MTGYRIGYLNPWTNAAENHACKSLAIAAQRLGHVLVPATNSDELLAGDLDFVIAVASTQPRVTDIPTFANIHEARTRWWENESYFQNLLTYDGYLTISDTLKTFIRAFASSVGKDVVVGEFFSSPQRMQIRCDIAGLVARRGLRLCYFGTNWDPRSRPLFRALARRDYVQIRGPEKSWSHLPRSSYFGGVPFDGLSVQMVYAAYGAGLVVHSRNHTLDDVVSNRVFEICSVGAAAVAPDMPWLRSRFGDALHYYDPWATASDTARRIDEIMNDITRDPFRAAEMAVEARTAFERRYCAEAMLGNAVTYFEGWKQRKAALRAPEIQQPEIDVIVRVGGRPLDVVMRAVKSIDEQHMGRFRVILVRYKPLDVQPLINANWKSIDRFEIVDCMGGNRAHTMAAGLRALESRHFAALDDDDFWLPDHIESMWRVLKDAPPDAGFAYCGLMDVEEGSATPDAPRERRTVVNLKPATGNIWDIVGQLGTVNFVASSALVRDLDLSDWAFTTAEDTLMICFMLQKASPEFTWRATACTVIHPNDRSNYKTQTVRRKEDVLEVFLRIGPRIETIERKFSPTPSTTWTWLGSRLSEVMEARSKAVFRDNGKLVLEEGMLSTSLHERDDVAGEKVPLGPDTVSVSGNTQFEQVESGHIVRIVPPPTPWGYALTIDLRPWLRRAGPQWVVLEFDSLEGGFGAGILNAAGDDFYSRIEAPRRPSPVELWLYVEDPASVSQLIVQNWGPGENNKAVLRNVWAVHTKEAPALAATA